MNLDNDVELEWEFSAQERAKLAFDIQEAYIRFWHGYDGQDPTSDEFNKFLSDRNLHWAETANMLDTTFGSYSQLLRSLGDIPQRNSTPQDAAEKAHRELDLPVTKSEMNDIDRTYGDMSHHYFGSHMGMIEALGFFDDYKQLIEKIGGESHHYQDGLKRRQNDEESLVSRVEEKFGKNYEEVNFKYQVN